MEPKKDYGMPFEQVIINHPLPWTQETFLIRDAKGQHVVHVGGITGSKGVSQGGEFLSRIAAMIVVQANSYNEPFLEAIEKIKDHSKEWTASPKQIAADIIAHLQTKNWRPMDTAPRNSKWIDVRMADGKVVRAHYAQGNGEEQPPYKGWFVGTSNSYFYQIEEPVAWREI